MLLLLFSAALLAADPSIRLERDANGQAVFRVSGVNDPSKLSVFVEGAGPGMPAVAGSSRTDGSDVVFVPRYPLEPGVGYRAVWNSEPAVSAVFEIPKGPPGPPVEVERVYPSAAVLPENQLKFYIHFSGPMTEAGSYRWIHLLRADGSEVEAPFLNLGEELWDPEGKRFTLLFNPGRVKRGLVPNLEMGPPLEAGGTYTLVIERGWPDASGQPLRAEFRKQFRVAAADRKAPDPKTWKMAAPPAGTRTALEIVFPESLDHALLGRLIEVAGPGVKAVAGAVSTADEERRWRLTPVSPWMPGPYRIRVDPALEDLAGNRIGRPFEVDLSREAESPKTAAAELTFTVR